MPGYLINNTIFEENKDNLLRWIFRFDEFCRVIEKTIHEVEIDNLLTHR